MNRKTISSIVAALITLGTAVEAFAQTMWYVADDNCPGPGSGSQLDPFCKIQDGIDPSGAGDTVKVSDGTYTGAGNRDLYFGGRLLTLHSENGPDTCIIDCEGKGRGFIFESGESGIVVEGFTVRNGSATAGGGGMSFSGSSPTIQGCVIVGNTVGHRGGGVSCGNGSSPLFLNVYIADNSAEYRGGGVHCDHDSSPIFIDSVITGNTVDYRGGGIYCDHNSNLTLINCLVSDNSAEYRGGGISCHHDSSPILVNSIITGNTVDYRGGGIYCDGDCHPTLINCLVSGNYGEDRGSGISCDHSSHAVIINSTISDNLGGGHGIYLAHESAATISNSIVWYNTSFQLGGELKLVSVTFSNLQGGWPGVGNIDVDPLFVDAAGGNYRLFSGSPCIDAADNNAVPEDISTDLDGDPRFVDDPNTDDTGFGDPPLVDMGAYEFQILIPCADDDGDGRVAICHIPPGNPTIPTRLQ